MRRALLDINVLLALLDSDHVDHKLARDWINAEIRHGWASCAITQNGFVRIISHPRYPNPVSPSQAIDLLARAASTEHHEFWPCTISVLDSKLVEHKRVHGPKQVTDAYLLALATAHEGRFVTFDQSVAISTVRTAKKGNLSVLRQPRSIRGVARQAGQRLTCPGRTGRPLVVRWYMRPSATEFRG